jgi:glycosyltransferase involved in cell wall biosynthesis
MKKDPAPLSLTVGITAFNEAGNIRNLLTTILVQEERGFALKKILVVSDASTDETVREVKAIKDPRVQLIDRAIRGGKNNGINVIFENADTDVVALLDADILLESSKTLSILINPFITDAELSGVSGCALPFPAKNFVQKVLTAGWNMWNDLRLHTPGAELYRSEGTIRAFRNSLYTQMRFEDGVTDEWFPYLYCRKYGYKFGFAPDAITYYLLPALYREYARGTVRILRASHIESATFESAFIEQFDVIKSKEKYAALAKHFITDPFWMSLYALFVLYPKMIVLLGKTKTHTSAWEMSTSTKKFDSDVAVSPV